MQTEFEIVWQASAAEAPVVLRSATDANEATMAFLEEHARLKTQEATGELLVRTSGALAPLLRQPLEDHDESARTQLSTTPRAPDSAGPRH